MPRTSKNVEFITSSRHTPLDRASASTKLLHSVWHSYTNKKHEPTTRLQNVFRLSTLNVTGPILRPDDGSTASFESHIIGERTLVQRHRHSLQPATCVGQGNAALVNSTRICFCTAACPCLNAAVRTVAAAATKGSQAGCCSRAMYDGVGALGSLKLCAMSWMQVIAVDEISTRADSYAAMSAISPIASAGNRASEYFHEASSLS